MSRNQFVRNTITAIQMQLQPSMSPARLSSSDLTYDDCASSIQGLGSDETELGTRSKRSDSVTSWNSIPHEALSATLPVSPAGSHSLVANLSNGNNGSTPSVAISNGHESARSAQPQGRQWESDMESLLKVSALTSASLEVMLISNVVGNVYGYQASTDLAAFNNKHYSLVSFLSQPRWNDVAQPQLERSARPSYDTQAWEHTRSTIHLERAARC